MFLLKDYLIQFSEKKVILIGARAGPGGSRRPREYP